MQDIGQLILGGSKPPPQQQSGDSFRFENLQPAQVQMAVKRFTDMGYNPNKLEEILTTPEKFNNYPLEVRKQFFELSPTGELIPPPVQEETKAEAERLEKIQHAKAEAEKKAEDNLKEARVVIEGWSNHVARLKN